MDENNENRINIEDLPKAAEELTDEEAKNVEGGYISGPGVYKTTDAGITWTGNTAGGTIGGSPDGDPSRKMGDGSV